MKKIRAEIPNSPPQRQQRQHFFIKAISALSFLLTIYQLFSKNSLLDAPAWPIADIAREIHTVVSAALGHTKLLALINAFYFLSYLLIFRRYIAPLRRILAIVQSATQSLQPTVMGAPETHHSDLFQAVATLASCAQEQSRLRADLYHQLATARQVLAEFSAQNATILRSASHEMIEQYRTVLGYANYLDAHIARHTDHADLRYDFDDVCESGFNLKLIAGALDMLRSDAPTAPQRVTLADLMQRTLFALAPSLDRRAMRLTSEEVDLTVAATTDPVIVTHVLWMMLLGTIRYAEAESTLRLRCLYDHDGAHALMSVVVSELAPGAMTPAERVAHLERQMQHDTPHMFAQTIREHANIRLATLLLQRIGAQIDILPLSNYACEICLKLPV